MGVEAKGLVSAVERAGVSEEQFCKSVCDLFHVAVVVDGAEGSAIGVAVDGAQDPLDGSSPAEDGAEDAIAGPSLGACIHFISVLLVSEDDGEEFGFRQKGRIGVWDDVLLGVSEDEAAECDSLGSPRDGSERVLARAHREEDGSDDNVGGVVILVGSEAPIVGELEEPAE
jgi:hypothetical protein